MKQIRRLSLCAALLSTCMLSEALAQAPKPQPELKRLRVLMAIDTYAPRLQEIVPRDKALMLKMLEEGLPPNRYTLDILENGNDTPTKILHYYANLETGPDEALLFYYVGHGGMTDKDHILTIEGDGKSQYTYGGVRYYRLNRKAVVNAMRAKQPGLVIVLTACCSSYIPERGQRDLAGSLGAAPPQKIVPTEIRPVIRSLFFEHRGVVDITAAAPGDPAIGFPKMGTIFTSNLVGLALNADPRQFGATDDFVTWKAFHQVLRQNMNDVAMDFKHAQEEAKKAGKLDKVSPELDVQLAYGFQLADEGKVPRPKWLFGVSENEYVGGTGVKLYTVFPNTPAEKAGLRVGDVIKVMNGRAIESNYDFTRTVDSSDGELKIEYVEGRSGKTRTLDVTLKKLD